MVDITNLQPEVTEALHLPFVLAEFGQKVQDAKMREFGMSCALKIDSSLPSNDLRTVDLLETQKQQKKTKVLFKVSKSNADFLKSVDITHLFDGIYAEAETEADIKEYTAPWRKLGKTTLCYSQNKDFLTTRESFGCDFKIGNEDTVLWGNLQSK